MLLASAGVKTLVTKTFTGSETWVVPAGVTRLESVSGKGTDGEPATTVNGTLEGYAYYYSTGSGNTSGTMTWESMNANVEAARSAVNLGGSGTRQMPYVISYPSTYSLSYSNISYTNAIAGTARVIYSGSWGTAGKVQSNGIAYIFYDMPKAATNGNASTGFGQTFPGGVGGVAPYMNYGPMAVNPGGNWPVSVLNGTAYITITYYV